jgi:foldase protein PrsA
MRTKKIAAFTMAAVLTAVSVTGCGIKSDTPLIGKIVGLKSDQIFQIEDLICSKQEYMIVLMNTENQYKSDFGGTIDWNTKIDGEETLQTYILKKVKEDISIKYTLAAMAETKNVTLTDEEKAGVTKAATEYFESLSEEEKSYTQADVSDVENVYINYLLADKVYTKLTENASTKVSDEEARVIKIQYIKMSTENTKESKIQSTLKNVVDLVNGGYQTFSREAKQYSEDSIVEKTLKKNEVTEKYEQEAFSLNDGEMSNVIQDGKNFYLVYCVDSYMKKETAKNKQNIIDTAKDEYFHNQYSAYLTDAKTDFNTDVYDDIQLSENDNVKNATLMEVYNTITETK